MYMKELRYFRNIWDQRRYEFLNWEAAKVKFPLEKIYHDFWIKLQEFYELFQYKMLNQQNAKLTPQEWVGLCRSMKDELSEWVVTVGYLKEYSTGPIQFSVEFMSIFPNIYRRFAITLTELKPTTRNVTPIMAFS